MREDHACFWVGMRGPRESPTFCGLAHIQGANQSRAKGRGPSGIQPHTSSGPALVLAPPAGDVSGDKACRSTPAHELQALLPSPSPHPLLSLPSRFTSYQNPGRMPGSPTPLPNSVNSGYFTVMTDTIITTVRATHHRVVILLCQRQAHQSTEASR